MMNRLKFWSQIEKLNNKTKSNIEEFIDIAKQIQEINSRTKIDSNTRKKLKTVEIGRDEIFEYIFKIENKKANGSKNSNNIYKNILYKNNNNKNSVENQMGVRCVAITPIVLTSFQIRVCVI